MKQRLIALLGLAGLLSTPVLAQETPTSPERSAAPATATTSFSCKVNPSSSTAGDRQLSGEDYKAAEATFRAALTADPKVDEVRLGLVRALIGQDRVAEAQTEAAAMLQTFPRNALAQVALSEVAYRAADLDGALNHARAALDDNPCEGRAAEAMADIAGLLGLYGRAARLLGQAHRLRPNDELIRRSWIGSLPRKERQAELSRYLDSEHDLSRERDEAYQNSLAHLQASRPGECRISSKSESASIPLRPVYGDRNRPVAFGLDVGLNKTQRRMQVDTGASGIILTAGAARSLKLVPEYKLKAGGIGDEGKVDSYLAHVSSITIGDVEISDCMVEVLGKSKLNVDGLIGMNVFSHFLVTLDYPDAKLELDPLPARPSEPQRPGATDGKPTLNDAGTDPGPQDRYTPPEYKDWTHILRIGHQILLPAEFKPGSLHHYMIMDTGASKTVLSTAMAKEAGKLHDSPMHFVGLSGAVKNVYEIDPTPLQVANLKLPPEGFFAYDITNISHNNGLETSGLLGLPTLQRLTIRIDYRDNLLKLTYDPKHDVMRF